MIHRCHWPGCPTLCAPRLWGCAPHWYQLPMRLREALWRAYRPGQEIDKRPSPQYIIAATDIQEWIKANADFVV